MWKATTYAEETLIALIKEREAGAKAADLCRRYGIGYASYYDWKAKLICRLPLDRIIIVLGASPVGVDSRKWRHELIAIRDSPRSEVGSCGSNR